MNFIIQIMIILCQMANFYYGTIVNTYFIYLSYEHICNLNVFHSCLNIKVEKMELPKAV